MRQLLSAFLLLALAACASTPPYAPAQGRDGAGYTETRIETDRYRVTYRGGGGDPTVSEDYALLRAAELTLNDGYQWFVVDARRTEGETGGARPTGSIGVAGGSGGGVGVGIGLGVGFGASQPRTTVLEIRLGKGERPPGAYDAESVSQSIRARRATQ